MKETEAKKKSTIDILPEAMMKWVKSKEGHGILEVVSAWLNKHDTLVQKYCMQTLPYNRADYDYEEASELVELLKEFGYLPPTLIMMREK